MAASKSKARPSAGRARVLALFSDTELTMLVASVLEKKTAEDLASKIDKTRRWAGEDRALVAARLALGMSKDTGAFKIIAGRLDQETRAQRTMVQSVESERLEEEIATLGILRFKRHGAKFVWALARDGRDASCTAVEQAVKSYFESVLRHEQAREQAATKGAALAAEALDEVVAHAQTRVTELESALSRIERERAELIVQLGKREAKLRREAAKHDAPEPENEGQDTTPQVQANTAVEQRASKRETRGAQKQAHAQRREAERMLAELRAENEALRRRVEHLRDALAEERRASAAFAKRGATVAKPIVAEPSRPGAPRPNAPKGDRVAVFVDVANVAGAARRLHNRAVDFGALLTEVLRGRTLASAHAYAIHKDDGFQAFAESLREVGYRVRAKKPRTFSDGSVKADWDVGITVDALTRAEGVDVVVLVSGDGDFVPVVAALQARGKQVEAVGFGARTSDALRRAAAVFVPLGESVLL